MRDLEISCVTKILIKRSMLETNKLLVAFFAIAVSVASPAYSPSPAYGYPAGLIPYCPGVLKNATISPKSLKNLQITSHRLTSTGIASRMMPIEAAHKIVARDKMIDLKNKRTVVYVMGYLDTSVFPWSKALGTVYSKRGYNVFILETIAFFSYIYPKAARLVPAIGQKVGEFLVKLSHQGLSAANLELVGLSLGAHVTSYAAKYFHSITGQKPSRLTGLDPAGPCFRALNSEHKFWRTDAERVDAVHTNIDGFGTAEPLGHIDIYVNGGEFQPGDVPYIPCLVICSHIKALYYWWQALEHPKKFIAAKCDSVQDARFGNCTRDSNNYLGLEAKFDRSGIYYLPTSNEFPYYMGKEGLESNDTIYTKIIKNINSDDVLIV